MPKPFNPSLTDSVLIESMTESVLITTGGLDPPGPFVAYVNPAFERMTGWSREEVIGKTPRILQGPKTDESVFASLRRALDEKGIWEGQTVNYRKDGREFVMEWSIVPVQTGDGWTGCYLAVQRDVTARVEMERDLAEAREAERRWSDRLELTSHKLSAVNKEQRRTLDLFMKYVPEPVVRKTLGDRGSDNLYSGELLHVALLFCDLRRFTQNCEILSPDRVVRLLNTYYGMMAKVIESHEGVIQQFVGDEIFVIFGAPVPVRNGEEKAVRCALSMVEEMTRINDVLAAHVGTSLEIKIGIHAGPVVAGNLGSKDRIAYAVAGDAVNTAKRIESLGGEGNPILISETIHDHVRSLVDANPWAPMRVKGKEEEVRVFQVLGLKPNALRGAGSRTNGVGKKTPRGTL